MKALALRPYTVKITCKYKLPALCETMKMAVASNPTYIVQNNSSEKWQNTEIWSVKTSMFKDLINKLLGNNEITSNNGMEERFYRVILEENCYRMPLLTNVARYKRGHGDVLKQL